MVGDDGGDVLLTCSHVGSDFLQDFLLIAQPPENHEELYESSGNDSIISERAKADCRHKQLDPPSG